MAIDSITLLLASMVAAGLIWAFNGYGTQWTHVGGFKGRVLPLMAPGERGLDGQERHCYNPAPNHRPRQPHTRG